MSLLFRNWWLLALKGTLSVVFGSLAIAYSDATIRVIVIYFGIIIITAGVFLIFGAVSHMKHNKKWAWWLAEGAFDLIFGLVIITRPEVTVALFVLIIGFWTLLMGLVEIVNAVNLQKMAGNWWLLGAKGIVSILFGVLVLTNPFATAQLLIIFVGLFAVVYGLFTIMTSFELRKLRTG